MPDIKITDYESPWIRFFDSPVEVKEHDSRSISAYQLREQILANAKRVFPNGPVDLLTGADEEGVGYKYAYIIRPLVNEEDPFRVLMAVRAESGYCPLLGLLRWLEEDVAAIMEKFIERDPCGWD